MAAPTDEHLVSEGEMAKLIPTLPLETRYPRFPLRRLSGFWLPEFVLPGVAAAHARFDPRPDDVVLASFPKSGTTWLKALAFATMHRDRHPAAGHPLRRGSPHECVKFLEVSFALAGNKEDDDVFASLPSPRVLATHLPYHLLPDRVGRVVYVCRDPKDAFVSGWLFTHKAMADKQVAPPPHTLEEAFELFCEGRCMCGPQWRHVLGYWEASRRWPEDTNTNKVLFLRYEEMLLDPAGNVRRLAEFLGHPFSREEEAAGTVDAVVDLCSIHSLKKATANVGGATTTELGVRHGSFFRKGKAGGWRDHLTPEMAARLDAVVAQALHGSGLTFGAVACKDDSAS
ncbi:hypothetical protein PR202_ga21977 [Eleusine coracana subsp. coracana]|uniref:Sulfotransferase n=1 Tax=Eleusine coracana subsp. coracana TaxID=191504 RepID=A0AAV5D2D7_ELECO|nr:hypothetical protein QOZ80_9AG0683110 [Eleusine coracana subsp. coracana]GJN04429.1 hypothetical protein PR202_ga21977 [Eleusine coracana subsp. coracana]